MPDLTSQLAEDFDPRPFWVAAGLFAAAGLLVTGVELWCRRRP